MRLLFAASLFALVGCSNNPKDHSPATTHDASVDADAPAPVKDSAEQDTEAPVDVGVPVTPGDPGPSDVRFSIRMDMGMRKISPLIYGTNGSPNAELNRPSVVRSGGNRLTAYNWENNGSNAGSDYCFQNDRTFVPPSGPNTPGYAVSPTLNEAKAQGHATIVTVPIVDHVAADTDDKGDGGAGPPACVGDVRKSGSDYLTTRFKQNRPSKGAPFSLTPDPTDAFVYQDEFVNWVKSSWGSQRVLFSLDNEPDLWAETHAELHPTKVGYDELVKRNLDYAKAIKAVWPTAQTLGFVSYGYAGYTTLQSAPDAAGKGDFVEYYLAKALEAEKAVGYRLIDYLDLHWYPEVRESGVRITDRGDGTAASARVQAPRSLWDPTFEENSWIVNDVLHEPIEFIPRYIGKLLKHYPGVQLAFSEWNYGGGNHISGAVATADALGVFGREGVGLATLWLLHGSEPFTLAGLRAFTNFDGAGAKFGEMSIYGVSSDIALASVYASVGAADYSRVTIVAINKSDEPKKAGITVAHTKLFTRAKAYVLQGTSASIVPAGELTAVATNAFNYTMPPMSVTVFALAP